ncbi:ATPase subunit of ABC transporter with duplicated ATPase domains [Pullulanibacillus pueri]|uniref:Putative ABC transporter ATP-binding protein YdiF n=1 Tax=Pullulanibacillus pueri TaxID=1437324 RepID=A0A8J3EN07_9BACL|nr:ABC-F type ribosomal protection protein [Pullulanibacillus pueri]MBM7684021.1 ATPase subunit of ABC transporter with duplicated ATPase domains [Pullulanibacillus pueri]GGH85063.1 putative ABC transporter ATP-binding protein YdiF [Pullulanibacillus pueri]
MYIFKADHLQKDWNGRQLFTDVNLELKEGEHLALFGRNGSGKTTLLKGLFNQLAFEKGTVHRFVPLEQWAWLEQNVSADSDLSARQMVESADRERFRLKSELEVAESRLKGDATSYPDIWETYSTVYEKFLAADGYNLMNEAERALVEVRLDEVAWDVPFQQLSGGQKTKVQLARLLLHHPRCILMDEPTNHLDQESLLWLEEWVRQFKGAILFVSHDRLFLDRVADALYELSPNGVKRYTGGYSAYREQKRIEWQTQETLYKKQEKERKELQEAINRYQKWFSLAHKAAGQNDFLRSKAKKNVSRFKAKESALERLEKDQVDRPKEDKKLNLHLQDSDFSARQLLQVEHLGFSYGEVQVLSGVSLHIGRGDRIAVIGDNGSGKTTLLKLLINELKPSQGTIYRHPQLKIGYFSQELNNLHEDETLLDSLLVMPEMTQSEARTILGSFLFPQDDVFKKIKHLSMGEKCRIAFLKLYFSDANLLVLDEPTNFLDVATREVIEYALEAYPGALVVVSHDRYLVQKVANRIVHLKDQQIEDFHGNLQEYEQFLQKGHLTNDEQRKENERQQLNLQLTQLMSENQEGASVEEQELLLQKIKETKQRIADLMKGQDKTK